MYEDDKNKKKENEKDKSMKGEKEKNKDSNSRRQLKEQSTKEDTKFDTNENGLGCRGQWFEEKHNTKDGENMRREPDFRICKCI